MERPDGAWVPPDPAAQAELRQLEIDLALADLDAWVATVQAAEH